jgi:hypothetical protein
MNLLDKIQTAKRPKDAKSAKKYKLKVFSLAALAFLASLAVMHFELSLRAADTATTKPVEKPPIVTREEWGSQPQPIPDSRRHTPKFITIHHAGVDWKPGRDPAAFVNTMQAWGQREKGWPDLAYHFLIAPDGRIFEARSMDYEPESNTKYDLQGHIGVELMGNFETQRPSRKQIESCVKLAAWLCQEKKIDPSQIAGHKDRAKGQTSCPGKDFYRYLESGQFIDWVKATLAGKAPEIDPGPPLEGGPTVVIDTPATQPAP